MKMLEAIGLRKSFGSLTAVEEVSLSVNQGECLGLLGPNGAGKTTTLSMIAGLLVPDRGEVRIDGEMITSDTSPVKQKLGVVPQDLALFDELTAKANLELFGALYGVDGATAARRQQEALTLVGLLDRAKDKVGGFSGGMKRRLNLAAALLHDPALLLLDEPTVGVDPQSRNAIFENLETLRAQGKTIIYTTHYMEEAARLCDRIAIIDHGKVIANDSLAGLLRLAPVETVVRLDFADTAAGDGPTAELQAEVRQLPGVGSVQVEGSSLRVGLEQRRHLPDLLAWLGAQRLSFEHLHTERPTLESVFLHLTGRSLRD